MNNLKGVVCYSHALGPSLGLRARLGAWLSRVATQVISGKPREKVVECIGLSRFGNEADEQSYLRAGIWSSY